MKRTKGKDGKIYYFSEEGKRVSNKVGQGLWIGENKGRIATGRVDYSNLTRSEKISYKAASRLRYKGKFITKSQEQIIKQIAEDIGVKLSPGEELSSQNGFNLKQSPSDILSGKTLKSWSKNERKETSTSVFNTSNKLSKALREGKEVIVKIGGVTYTGKEAVDKLRKHDRQIFRDADKKGVRPMIGHQLEIGFDVNGDEAELYVDVDESFVYPEDE